MGKHSLKQETGFTRSVGKAVVVGTVATGAIALPAVPAMAQTVSVPNVGNFEVPNLPAPVQMPVLPQLPPPPAVPNFAPPSFAPQNFAPQDFAPQVAQTDGARALAAAKSKVGAQYVWGASGPNSFDCSGLVKWAYAQAGITVPRTTYGQMAAGTPVSKGNLQPGDIVLYDGGGHVGMYAGDGKIVHASTTGQPVKYAPVNSMPFYAARRF